MNMIGPKKGEKWTIGGGYKNLTFIGVGRDFSQTKYFIFDDPVDGMFVITKDEFYSQEFSSSRKKEE